VRARAYEFDEQWLGEALEIATFGELSQLLEVYTWASRHAARTPLSPWNDSLPAAPFGIPLGQWTVQDGVRALLLLARAEAAPDPDVFAADAITCYEQGDTGEHVSWLRSISLLPCGEALLSTAIDACRTNITPVFEAIACENPYPARHFPERNFNQLVLKSLFKGVSLARIVGLPSRLNPDLSRMALDYARERAVAGRPVPADISLVVTEACEGATVRRTGNQEMEEQPR
jgi:hypothetical protein